MEFIGHKAEDGRVQSVLEHLTGTAERAGAFGEAFGAESHARRTGLMHDIGKYAVDVQRRMADPEHVGKVNHTSAGAIEVCERWRDLPATFAIAGHHGGLADKGSKGDTPSDGTLQGKLCYKPMDYSIYRHEVQPEEGDLMPGWLGRDLKAASFYTRMLFSCLVDADFLDTEAFMQAGKVQREAGAPMATLLERLDEYVRPWFPGRTAINEKRCDILKRCRQAGEGPKGLYTLTVPTGGGKTVSSLGFALTHAVVNRCQRIIYVVPYMSIIEQNAAKFAEILGEENVLEHHSGVEYDEFGADDAAQTSQIGKRLATENWDAPVVVTTAVQFFESLYGCRTSKCRKLHNIANSVIILDEAQMMPLDFLMPCVWALAELVQHYGATAVLCTATQPALNGLFRQCASELAMREIMEHPAELYDFFRRVTFMQEGIMEVHALSDRLTEAHQVLCVVNTRKRAQAIFESLPGEGRFHLSTLLTPEDRRRTIARIRRRLADGEVCRVVSTSLIEAGVDVDFPTVWREEAGLDSILQAAGRCNREGKRSRQESIVHVFCTEKLHNKQVDAMRFALESCPEMDSPEAIRLYFLSLLQAKGEMIDKRGILRECEAFNFRTVAEKFRIIEDNTVTVYIPNEENGDLLDSLREGCYDRHTIRRLQRDGVSVYQQHAQRLMASGMVWQTKDGFLILMDPTGYDPERGLTLGEEGGQAVFI